MWPMPSCINATIFIIKNLQYNFPKMRGGGIGHFEFFPKIHPIWLRDPSLRVLLLEISLMFLVYALHLAFLGLFLSLTPYIK